jgi:hypothetical protein
MDLNTVQNAFAPIDLISHTVSLTRPSLEQLNIGDLMVNGMGTTHASGMPTTTRVPVGLRYSIA